ncbi:hypothetical protein L249_6621 [Ophiocordyceps polyrhachis-furcata BCC 54312]|uniref:Uncharacterized protein n=1 Tax=Ophiocordyceps polyrhachis-furcata BCC 54312 TaxID=1330021 RepID=A0A367LJJ8_9HYPO|nr:hypothetical protein L249_6621 [Ophiocordyceps polyrhachis-furcata BCC 54312]
MKQTRMATSCGHKETIDSGNRREWHTVSSPPPTLPSPSSFHPKAVIQGHQPLSMQVSRVLCFFVASFVPSRPVFFPSSTPLPPHDARRGDNVKCNRQDA